MPPHMVLRRLSCRPVHAIGPARYNRHHRGLGRQLCQIKTWGGFGLLWHLLPACPAALLRPVKLKTRTQSPMPQAAPATAVIPMPKRPVPVQRRKVCIRTARHPRAPLTRRAAVSAELPTPKAAQTVLETRMQGAAASPEPPTPAKDYPYPALLMPAPDCKQSQNQAPARK
jgi:hypothetical protein